MTLLDQADLLVSKGERLCLVGRNGTGKSTCSKIAGQVALDDGMRIVDNGVRISVLPQDPPATSDIKIFDYVAEGLAEVGELLSEYQLTDKLTDSNLSQSENDSVQRHGAGTKTARSSAAGNGTTYRASVNAIAITGRTTII